MNNLSLSLCSYIKDLLNEVKGAKGSHEKASAERKALRIALEVKNIDNQILNFSIFFLLFYLHYSFCCFKKILMKLICVTSSIVLILSTFLFFITVYFWMILINHTFMIPFAKFFLMVKEK